MAREAVLRDEFGSVLVKRRYTCATGTGITKGTFLKVADPYTASASTGTGDRFVGFAHADVNTSTDSAFNTETSVTAVKGGVFELVASGAITAGDKVVTAAPGNYVKKVTNENVASLAIVVGVALETASDGETINVEVYP